MASKRAALMLLLGTPLLPQCMPDFEALSAGVVGTAGVGTAGDGGAAPTGASGGGAGTSAGTGGTPDGGKGGSTSGGAAGGSVPMDTAGEGGESGASAAGAPAQGGEPGCGPDMTGVTVHNGFDGGVDAPGFSGAAVDADVTTMLKATASALWDSQEGNRCAGALRLSCAFKGYASGDAADEKAFLNYFFERQDWSEASALHASVKVSPTAPPITGVRLFVLSGTNYLYTSTFDATSFQNGDWNEMVLPLQAGTYYDPTNVHRIGVEVALLRADAPDIPATPPVIDVWVDDVWLEPR